jgi:hypothetical protein
MIGLILGMVRIRLRHDGLEAAGIYKVRCSRGWAVRKGGILEAAQTSATQVQAAKQERNNVGNLGCTR